MSSIKVVPSAWLSFVTTHYLLPFPKLCRRVHQMQILVFFPDIDILIQVRTERKGQMRE
jgi:hypothetical protein